MNCRTISIGVLRFCDSPCRGTGLTSSGGGIAIAGAAAGCGGACSCRGDASTPAAAAAAGSGAKGRPGIAAKLCGGEIAKVGPAGIGVRAAGGTAASSGCDPAGSESTAVQKSRGQARLRPGIALGLGQRVSAGQAAQSAAPRAQLLGAQGLGRRTFILFSLFSRRLSREEEGGPPLQRSGCVAEESAEATLLLLVSASRPAVGV